MENLVNNSPSKNNQYKMNNTINWSEKVRHLDKTVRKEIGVNEDIDPKYILIKVQTKSSESIEPAFIVGEDEIFLDLFVLTEPHGGITSTAVLKENIQSVGVLGGITAEKIEDSDVKAQTPQLDFNNIYQ